MEVQKAENTNSTTQQTSGHVFNIPDKNQSNFKSGEDLTQTGELRENPFILTNMNQAYQNLYDTTASLEATDLYVRFTPENLDEVTELLNSDLLTFEYPLEYEVLVSGDYYQEYSEGEFPDLFTVVDVNYEFPDIGYEVIDELYINKEEMPVLLAEAFRIKGHYDEINNIDWIEPEDLEDIGYMVPVCTLECPPNCTPRLKAYWNEVLGEMEYKWYCDCPPPSSPCDAYSNERKPNGRVRVEDSELENFEGVKNVQVYVYDGWFDTDRIQTNSNGCWRSNQIHTGKMVMWIKFKNNRAKIRGATPGLNVLWEWTRTVKHKVGTTWGPNYQNIDINYLAPDENSLGSVGHLYWGAATVNNAVHDFHSYASQEGIGLPPNNIDIYISRNRGDGFCIMGTQYLLGAQASAILIGGSSFIGNIVSPIASLASWPIAISYLPEVMIGIDFTNSDIIKAHTYHEIAHASHYNVVGHNYWVVLAEAEIKANGHGDQNSWQAGRIAICESWAEHVELSFAEETYSTHAWFSNPSSYIELLELRRNESANHIPIGLYNDLIDGININETAGDGFWGNTNTGTINDNVSGLTNVQLFSLLDNSVTSPNDFITKLNNSGFISGSNTTSDVNNLFNSY